MDSTGAKIAPDTWTMSNHYNTNPIDSGISYRASFYIPNELQRYLGIAQLSLQFLFRLTDSETRPWQINILSWRLVLALILSAGVPRSPLIMHIIYHCGKIWP